MSCRFGAVAQLRVIAAVGRDGVACGVCAAKGGYNPDFANAAVWTEV